MADALDALGVASAAQLGEVTLGYGLGFGHEPRVAFLAEAWRQAFGLQVEQVGSDRGVFLEDRAAGRYDIASGAWAADYPHALNQLNGVFTCGGNSVALYCNPEFDALIASAANELDPDRQVAIFNEAQTMLMNDAPILPLRFAVNPYAVKPYVSGLTEHPSDGGPGDYFYETIQILAH
jgi:oligopeptide transport system substrate-binding protein